MNKKLILTTSLLISACTQNIQINPNDIIPCNQKDDIQKYCDAKTNKLLNGYTHDINDLTELELKDTYTYYRNGIKTEMKTFYDNGNIAIQKFFTINPETKTEEVNSTSYFKNGNKSSNFDGKKYIQYYINGNIYTEIEADTNITTDKLYDPTGKLMFISKWDQQTKDKTFYTPTNELYNGTITYYKIQKPDMIMKQEKIVNGKLKK